MLRVFIFLITSVIFANEVTNYHSINRCVGFGGRKYQAIREFNLNGKEALLIVDRNSLNTYIVNKKDTLNLQCFKTADKYTSLLALQKILPNRLQNSGYNAIKDGIVITTDLCPSSKKGFEKELYQSLIEHFKNPVPVTLFITKRWIQKHKSEFEQLKRWQIEKKLNITWGNHTAYHIYHPKFPLEHNFVLSKEENLTKDVLDLEITLLENGVIPSIFFRFPGLVSDKKSVEKITELGLIVIGSNSWIAKNQQIKNGSIILLHGNKNEHIGVEKFLKILKEQNITQPIDIKNSYPVIERTSSNENNSTPINIEKRFK